MEYHYLIMSQTDMLKNEILEEILRERNNYYTLKKKTIDFWILISPNFLLEPEIKKNLELTNYFKENQKKEKYNSLNESHKNYSFFSVLISSDKNFINWAKLRIGFFENINNIDVYDNSIKSNGIYGFIKSNENNNVRNILSSNKYLLNSSFLISKYEKILEIIE